MNFFRNRLECSCDRRKLKAREEKLHSTSAIKKEPETDKSKSFDSEEKSPLSDNSGHKKLESSEKEEVPEKLLIDRNSPNEENGGSSQWSEITIVDTDNNTDDKLRDLSFTDIALRKSSALPILNQLPENASSLHIDSFIPSDLTKPNLKVAGNKKSLNIFTTNKLLIKDQQPPSMVPVSPTPPSVLQ